MSTLQCVAAMVVVAVQASAAAATRPIEIADFFLLRTVTQVDVADDGSSAIITVQSFDTGDGLSDEENWQVRGHLFQIDLTRPESSPLQLTFGANVDSNASVSPDGRQLAFLRHPAETKTPSGYQELRLVSLRGGESRILATFPNGAGRPVWSPDGKSIATTVPVEAVSLSGAPDYDHERPLRTWGDIANDSPNLVGDDAEIRAWLERNAVKGVARVSTDVSNTSRRSPREFSQILVVGIETENSVRRVTNRFADCADPVFTPDSRRIAYSVSSDGVNPDRSLERSIRSVAVDGSDDRPLVAVEGRRLTRPRFSRDGSTLAFLSLAIDEPAFRLVQLGLAAADGTSPLIAGERMDLSVRDFAWSSTGAGLYFTASHEGATALFNLAPGMTTPAVVAKGRDQLPITVGSFDAGASALVYVESSIARPNSVILRDLSGERLLFDPNPWVAERSISFPVESWISRPDGRRVQSWVLPPLRQTGATRYPVVVQIHGGPSAMWGPGEPTIWFEQQYFAASGYGIVYCNPRGSGGYGEAFQRANRQDWGEGPGGDVLAALDHALVLDWVDPNRQFIMGGSYGGFLTAWIVAHDNRFKAAVAERGVYDLLSFFGNGDSWRMVEQWMGVLPFDRNSRSIIDRNSPLGDARRIQTPLLLIEAGADTVVGAGQSETLFRTLKVLNKPVELVVYPGADHGLPRSGDPRQRVDRLLRIREFFQRFSSQ